MTAQTSNTEKVKEVIELDPFNNEYVYDIGVSDTHPYFFANDILVHNSCFFSAWPKIQESDPNPESWTKERFIEYYDQIAENTNKSFPAFMKRAFNCTDQNSQIIKAGRETIGDRGIFITKKRYAINNFDKEGKRLDVDGKPGKIKAMGLDLKRADTPKYIQNFLMDILKMVLAGQEKDVIIQHIRQFKIELADKPSWHKGSPKGVNKLTYYATQEKNSKTGKANMPGHVRAALNWNWLRTVNHDFHSMEITDGAKVVVCKLKTNQYGFTSVAYPVDEPHLPEWFTSLPFDDKLMEQLLVEEKTENLLGVLNWDLRLNCETNSTVNSLFSFD